MEKGKCTLEETEISQGGSFTTPYTNRAILVSELQMICRWRLTYGEIHDSVFIGVYIMFMRSVVERRHP